MASAPRRVVGVAPELGGLPLLLAGITLALTNFMVVLDTTIANVSVPHIAGSLGIAPNQGVWVITSYSVAEAVCVPLTGWLSQRFGTVRLFLFSLAGFGLFSTLCGCSWSLGMLVLCRVGQGLCGGPLLPICQTLLIRVFPPRLRGQAMGLWAMTTVVAPVVGPLLGGAISDDLSWHWIFFINIPVAALCAAGAVAFLLRFETPSQRAPIDRVGLGLLVVWIACLQVMLDIGRERDWFGSPLIVALAVVAGLFFVVFVIWELTEAHPVVDIRVFRHRGFTASVVALSVTFGTYFASTVVIPQWLQGSLGYTAAWAGRVTAWSGVLAVVSAPIVGRLVSRFDPRLLVFGGVLWTAGATLMRTHWTTGADYWTLAIPQLVAGAGMPFFFVPISILALAAVEPRETASAAGLMAFFRTLAGAVATSIASTMWFDAQQTRQAQLVDVIRPSSEIAGRLASRGIGDAQSRALFDRLVEQESVTLATTHIFAVAVVVFVFAACLVWLVPKPERTVNSARAH